MNGGEIVGIVVGVLAICAAFWRLTRSVYRLVRLGETSLSRLSNVEKQLRPNGGESLRDVLDQVHGIAQDNAESNARLENKAHEAVITAGEAARLASIAKQELDQFRDESRSRHAENLSRFTQLENNDKDHEILRELLLMQLKEKHGIDLLPDEDIDDG